MIEPSISIVPTDADYEACLKRMFLTPTWREIKERAIQTAAERMIEENQAEQRRLIAENQDLRYEDGGAARVKWLENQDCLTTLFAEHEVLLRAAYPEAYL
jgi:hypothetical protein